MEVSVCLAHVFKRSVYRLKQAKPSPALTKCVSCLRKNFYKAVLAPSLRPKYLHMKPSLLLETGVLFGPGLSIQIATYGDVLHRTAGIIVKPHVLRRYIVHDFLFAGYGSKS